MLDYQLTKSHRQFFDKMKYDVEIQIQEGVIRNLTPLNPALNKLHETRYVFQGYFNSRESCDEWIKNLKLAIENHRKEKWDNEIIATFDHWIPCKSQIADCQRLIKVFQAVKNHLRDSPETSISLAFV
ncbi:unnamed protein product [marine sediment metagenome]|uniref:Uncharacterized protein n=1 Tax=marine sediment metagenome TaxID=412755 RepID=X1LCI9_9ZZZZ